MQCTGKNIFIFQNDKLSDKKHNFTVQRIFQIELRFNSDTGVYLTFTTGGKI